MIYIEKNKKRGLFPVLRQKPTNILLSYLLEEATYHFLSVTLFKVARVINLKLAFTDLFFII